MSVNLSGLNAFGQAIGSLISNNPTLTTSIITAAQSAFGDPNEATEVNYLKKGAAMFAAGQGVLAMQSVAEATKTFNTNELAIQLGLSQLTAATPSLTAVQTIQIAINALQGK